MPRSRLVRNLIWGAGGAALGIALAFMVMSIVARTEMGHEFVLKRTLRALGGSIKGGSLEVARIDGNLFEGARLYGVALRERDGTPFVLADSADMDYDVVTLMSPRIRITRLVLYRPRIYVRRMPGDSLWNYQAIFRDTVPQDPNKPRVERVTILDSVRVIGGTTAVDMAWLPDSTLSERGQRQEVRDALQDTSPLMVRRVPGGYVRRINVANMDGKLRQIRFAPGSKTGSRFVIDSLRARLQFFRRPAEIRHVQGVIALLPDRLEFDSPLLRLPGSRIAASGVVCMAQNTTECAPRVPAGELPYYDVAFRSDSVSFRDLQWIYPRFPSEARGALQLLIETRREGILFDIRGARLTAPGTRVTGNFGIVVGDTVLFHNVDVTAEPIRISTIEKMMPEGLPVRGLILGGATIRGNNAAPADTTDESDTADAADATEAESDSTPRPRRPARTRPAE